MGGDVTEDKALHPAILLGMKAGKSIKTGITDESALKAERISLKIKELNINGFISQNGSVANFRNIQYARIPARWRQAVPIDPTKEIGVLDATQWGPRPPQPADVLHDSTKHLYPRMATFDRQSEFECLNLNICSPLTALGDKGRGLPVLVWIHGGAFMFGDGGCEFGLFAIAVQRTVTNNLQMANTLSGAQLNKGSQFLLSGLIIASGFWAFSRLKSFEKRLVLKEKLVSTI